MNYYPHHIGDYSAHTAHLSPLEDCFYRRMLDRYYQTEEPLPADESKLFRVLRATTKGDKQAVRAVAAEFFQVTPEGLRQVRCDREISLFRAAADRARANGAKGGRPKKNPDESEDGKTQPVISGLGLGNPEETHGKANQNQEPRTKEKQKDNAPPALSLSDLERDGLSATLAAEYVAHRKRKRANLTPTAWEGVKAQAKKAGITPSQAVAKCLERGWTGFEADWLGTSPATGYRPPMQSRLAVPSAADHEKYREEDIFR